MPYLARTGFGPSVNTFPTDGILLRLCRPASQENPDLPDRLSNDPSWCRRYRNATFWSRPA
jgi:hypothetical protein